MPARARQPEFRPIVGTTRPDPPRRQSRADRSVFPEGIIGLSSRLHLGKESSCVPSSWLSWSLAVSRDAPVRDSSRIPSPLTLSKTATAERRSNPSCRAETFRRFLVVSFANGGTEELPCRCMHWSSARSQQQLKHGKRYLCLTIYSAGH